MTRQFDADEFFKSFPELDIEPYNNFPTFEQNWRFYYDHGYAQAKRDFERPQGEWKETGYETGALGITYRQTQCSNCGWEHALPMWWNFCPNCGADMRGEEE